MKGNVIPVVLLAALVDFLLLQGTDSFYLIIRYIHETKILIFWRKF